MNKTDNRHYNNTRANKSLHKELDLWVAFVNNDKKPILLWKATDGRNDYELFYDGEQKERPYYIYGELGNFIHKYETIEKAKRHLRSWNSKAKSVKK